MNLMCVDSDGKACEWGDAALALTPEGVSVVSKSLYQIAHLLNVNVKELENTTHVAIDKILLNYMPRQHLIPDKVKHPPHYTQGSIECIDAIAAATQGLSGMEAVCVSQVIKYTWRYKHKNGVEDLQKAQWYLNKLINTLEN